MNEEEEGFVILNQSGAAGGLLYNYMKIYGGVSFLFVATTYRRAMPFTVPFLDHIHRPKCTHILFFSITSSVI